MNLVRQPGTATRRFSGIASSAVLAVFALGVATACDPVTTDGPAPATATATPAISASPTASAMPSTTPSPPPPPTLGWPRDGWTAQTLGFSGISVSIPNTWTFDNNEVGLWTDGTAKVFCDSWRDPELLVQPIPNVIDLANSRWNITFGAGAAANTYGFQTFYGGNVWGADVTLGDGVTVEPRAFIVKDDVWIHCGAITRGTTSTAPELHDIIDSIQIIDPAAMQVKSWMENP